MESRRRGLIRLAGACRVLQPYACTILRLFLLAARSTSALEPLT